MAGAKADIFLAYCTNAVLARKEVASLRIVQVPPELSAGADYGMVVLKGAPPSANALAAFILSDAGQAILAKYGFGAGDHKQAPGYSSTPSSTSLALMMA